MARAERVEQVVVVAAALVLVADQQRNRRTRGQAAIHAGKDLDPILLAPLGHVARGARLAAIEIGLKVIGRQRQTRRTAVDHAADRRPVRFAEVGDPEQMAESGSRHGAGF
jgi:hypothetical protein